MITYFDTSGFMPIVLAFCSLGFLTAQLSRQTVRYIYALFVSLYFGAQAYSFSISSFPLADISNHQVFAFWWTLSIYFVSIGGLWVGDKVKISR